MKITWNKTLFLHEAIIHFLLKGVMRFLTPFFTIWNWSPFHISEFLEPHIVLQTWVRSPGSRLHKHHCSLRARCGSLCAASQLYIIHGNSPLLSGAARNTRPGSGPRGHKAGRLLLLLPLLCLGTWARSLRTQISSFFYWQIQGLGLVTDPRQVPWFICTLIQHGIYSLCHSPACGHRKATGTSTLTTHGSLS